MRPVVESISQRQGCLPWDRIWRKPAVKSRSDKQKPDKRLEQVGKFAIQNEALTLPETCFCKSTRYMTWRRYYLPLDRITETG